MALQPKIARLKSQLAVTGLQKEDNALFQVIDGLIRALEQTQAATIQEIASGGGGGGGGFPNESYLLYNPSGSLPNSRELLAGLGVQFDDTVANERTVDVIGEREIDNFVTGSIGSGGTESGSFTIGATPWQTIQLVKLVSDRAGYLVLYASAADRDADTRTLPATTDPVAGEGVFLDAAFGLGGGSLDISPPVLLYNNEAPVIQTLYYRFFNQEATVGVTTFTMTFVVSNGGGGTGGGSVAVAHNMLSATHSDSTTATGVDGDLIVHDTTWKRLPKSTDGRALILTAGLPAWSLDGSALSLDAAKLASGIVPVARLPIPNEATINTTGDIDDLAVNGVSLIRMNNASLSTIRGLVAGVAGQLLTIVSIGAGQVNLAHQNTNSAASNRLLNFVTSGVTPLAAGVGSATYQYDATTQRWRLVTHNQGAFIDVPYTGTDFTGFGSMTWTVEAADLREFKYWIKDRIIAVQVSIFQSSISGVVNIGLNVLIPNGYTNSQTQAINQFVYIVDNGTRTIGITQNQSSVGTLIQILKNDITNWVASTNNTAVFGTFVFGIN